MIGIVFSNPRHHAEMLLPVAGALAARGELVRVVSLAELRGFVTPEVDHENVEVIRAVPPLRKKASAGAGGQSNTRDILRRVAKRVAWSGLAPRLWWLLRGCKCVVVPNDAAFPYRDLTRLLRYLGIPFVLMQEGIRFPLPVERAEAYGRGGASVVCAWGEGAAEHFRRIGVAERSIRITGNPRFDGLRLEDWRARGRSILDAYGLQPDQTVLYLSNPIDDQGFCSATDKMKLFEQFLDEATDELVRRDMQVMVRLHPREDAAPFRSIAERAGVRTVVVEQGALFELLAVASAAIVLASTAGLEALAFGVPLGVLALPGHGFLFEYVSSGAAVGLEPGHILPGVVALLDRASERAPASIQLVQRHLSPGGQAAERVAEAIRRVTAP